MGNGAVEPGVGAPLPAAERIRRPPGPTGELADGIVRQVDRFLGMAQEILDFTRGVSVSRLREADFGGAMDSFLRFVEGDLGRSRVVLVRDLRFQGRVRMDPERLRRAFHSIVDNARDAMPRGGTLRVTTCEREGFLCVEFADEGSETRGLLARGGRGGNRRDAIT